MKFVSTSNPRIETDLAEAIRGCIAPDGGLLLPAGIPRLPVAFFNNIAELSLQEIAYVVATSFFGEDIAPQALKRITDRTFAAGIPLVSPLGDGGPHVLELFHGPTLTVKDFGAAFMAGISVEIAAAKSPEKPQNILLASSGNSAVAIAAAFRNLKSAELYVICPHGSVRRKRHSILSSFGPRVHLLEIAGGIDQCNAIVRTFIADEREAGNDSFCGANSANIARLIPEVTFYFHAYARLREKYGAEIAGRAAYAIPCGNLTALVAAVIARKMGLPLGRIVAAGATTDALGNFLRNETTSAPKAHSRYARAMNADHPTNLPRLVSLCGGRDGIAREIECRTVDDDTIADTVRKTRLHAAYSLNPHSAVAFSIADEFTAEGVPVVCLATAHPAADIDAFTEITGAPVELPVQLTRLMDTRLSPVEHIAPTVPALRRFIRNGALKNRT